MRQGRSENDLCLHAQLFETERWFRETYPGCDSVKVSALPEPVADGRATQRSLSGWNLVNIGIKLV